MQVKIYCISSFSTYLLMAKIEPEGNLTSTLYSFSWYVHFFQIFQVPPIIHGLNTAAV